MTPMAPRHRDLVRRLARSLDRVCLHPWQMGDALAELLADAGPWPGIQEAAGAWEGEPGGREVAPVAELPVLLAVGVWPALLDPAGKVIP